MSAFLNIQFHLLLRYSWQIDTDSGRFGKRRFGKNMAAEVLAKKWRNVSYDMWGISGVCPLALTEQDGNISGPKGPRGTRGNENITEARFMLSIIPTLIVSSFFFTVSAGHGNKFDRICSNFNFEWTKFEFSKNRNKFDSLCSNFEQIAVGIKRASDISPFHLVPRGPLGPFMFPSC